MFAELLIHGNIMSFLKHQSKGVIIIMQAFNVGLIKSKVDHSSAVSPDATAVLKRDYSIVDYDFPKDSDDVDSSQVAKDA